MTNPIPPFLKGEISHNDLDGTTIKAAKIYKTGGLEIKVGATQAQDRFLLWRYHAEYTVEYL
jgi:hypothetical protein